jgi:small subunit ribosomal protein S20
MPNIKSAKKRVRQSEKRRLRNRYRLVTTRNLIKKLLKTKEAEAAQAMLPEITSALDRLAVKRIIHRNKAANQKSRLTRFVNSLQKAA